MKKLSIIVWIILSFGFVTNTAIDTEKGEDCYKKSNVNPLSPDANTILLDHFKSRASTSTLGWNKNRATFGDVKPATNVNNNATRLQIRGLYVQFERRGWASGYWSGQVISDFNEYDSLVGHTVAEEVALQLDKIREMGVNTIAFELRASDPTWDPGPFLPPACNIGPSLGLQYPQPTSKEISNLIAFYDLVNGKGIKILLRLVNTHMEEQPPTNNATWLNAILNAIKDHPAFELVLFEGNTHQIDTNGDGVNDACGIPAEPPLWLGPTALPCQYVKWAINYAHSLGIPFRKLSAEAIVGDYFVESQPPAGPSATDGHLWSPIAILKGIFDDLSIPNDQRTYAISFYEHRKCSTAQWLECVGKDPNAWADETLQYIFDTIGRLNGARVIAVEMGLNTPVEANWSTEQAFESLFLLMQKHSVEGGCFWRWTSFSDDEETNTTLASPVKQRGVNFNYNPVKNVLEKYYSIKDDFVGTWDGQGVYYRNSDTASWVKLATPATLVTAGDLDGDGIDDLIGIWPGQGGVWVKYSATGAWAKLSTTARHIAAGDMNGDGRPELLGTWDGQGVYWRNNTTGAWTQLATPATLITSGDLDGDGSADLIGIWPSQGGVWVKYSQTGAWAKLSTTAVDIAAGDMNGDGRDDLLATWDGQGVYYRNSIGGAWVKMATPATQVTVGDLDGDGTDDVIGIWPSQSGVWVKYSHNGAWAYLSTTAVDIAAGRMRAAGSSSLLELDAAATAESENSWGPDAGADALDLSSNAPGGMNFACPDGVNLEPRESGDVIHIPGPGEPGFRCLEQKNLVPGSLIARDRDREPKREQR